MRIPFTWPERLVAGFIVVGTIVYYNQKPSPPQCIEVSNVPNSSTVYRCPSGLDSVALHGPDKWSATVSSSVDADSWFTTDTSISPTPANVDNLLGKSNRIKVGSYIYVPTGQGIVYFRTTTYYLITVAWHHA